MAENPSPKPELNNRRSTDRALACYPAELSTGGENALALIRDVSVKGALLFLQVPQDVGFEVTVHLYILPDPNKALTATAKVVRMSTRRLQDRGVWKYAAAVEFTRPLTEAAEAIEQLAKTLPPVPVGEE